MINPMLSLIGFIFLSMVSPYSYCGGSYLSVDTDQLDNGLQIITLPRKGAKNVVVEIAVDVGKRDFPCDRSQTAHVLEHMAFGDTETISAEKLKENVEIKAGEMNGYSEFEQTLYYIQIHSDYLDVAITSLYKMLFEVELTEESLRKAKAAVHSENGTSDNYLRTLAMDKLPIMDRAVAALYPDSGYGCDQGLSPGSVQLSDIVEAHEKYHRASNMHMVVVGDFDKKTLMRLLENNFQQLPALPKRAVFPEPNTQIETDELVNYITPFSSSALMGFAMRTSGYLSDDSVALEVIRLHLQQKLYERARLGLALGYTPRVEYQSGPEYGHFVAKTETNYQWVEEAKAIFDNEFNKMRLHGMTAEEFEKTKSRQLLILESKPRRNKDVAYELANYRHWIRQFGGMRDLVEETRALTVDQVNDVVQRFFNQPIVYGLHRPATIGVTLLRILGVIAVSALVTLPIFYAYKKVRSLFV